MIHKAVLENNTEISLPQEVRDSLNLHKGDTLVFQKVGPTTYTVRKKGKPGAARGILAGRIEKRARPVTVEEMNEAIEQAVAESYRSGLDDQAS